MADTTTLAVPLPDETNQQLARLAGRLQRTPDVLAAEAIADYVARELAVAEAIEAGLADVRTGRVTPHEVVMRDARAVIESARAKR